MPPCIQIAGVYSHPNRDLGGPPLPDDEYAVLVNTGDLPVDMRGWSLTNRKRDQLQHYRYHFPRFLSGGDSWELEPGGMVLLYTGRGTNGATATTGEAHQYHLYQHRTTWIWQESGDIACLYSRTGELVAWHELAEVPKSASS
jgi:hypothetical protein